MGDQTGCRGRGRADERDEGSDEERNANSSKLATKQPLRNQPRMYTLSGAKSEFAPDRPTDRLFLRIAFRLESLRFVAVSVFEARAETVENQRSSRIKLQRTSRLLLCSSVKWFSAKHSHGHGSCGLPRRESIRLTEKVDRKCIVLQ